MTADPSGARVLVCDESASYGQSLARFLGAGAELDVVGVCATGEEAVAATSRLAPELVTMDLELPTRGGIHAIEAIMRTSPVPIVVLSAEVRRGSARADEALAAGALDTVAKGQLHLDAPEDPAAVALRHRLRRLARNDLNHRSPPRPEPLGEATAVGICASAGGPSALEVVLPGLPADFPLPVLVVQHIAAGFVDGLIRWLDQCTALAVRVAEHDQPAGPGIWFPPEDTHLLLAPSMRLALDPETDVGPHRPSADLLLESMASAAGSGAVGVMLTGMGRDGARGVDAVRRAGGSVIAQDEQSSALFGMPRAAAEAGAETVLPLSEIAEALRRLPVAGRLA